MPGKASVTRSVRIEKDADERLRHLAEQGDTSVNTLVNRALRKFVEWDAYGEKFGFITLPSAMLIKLMDCLTDEEARELLRLTQVIVTARPGWRLDEVERALTPAQRAALGDPTFKYLRISEVGPELARTPPVPGLVLLVEVVSLDISSREIRQLVEEGRSVRFLVPDTVAAYMQKNRLYQKRSSRPGGRKEGDPHRG